MGNCLNNQKVQPEFDGIQQIKSCYVCDLKTLKIDDFMENHSSKYKVSEIREIREVIV
jgi:hypothetical protein